MRMNYCILTNGYFKLYVMLSFTTEPHFAFKHKTYQQNSKKSFARTA